MEAAVEVVVVAEEVLEEEALVEAEGEEVTLLPMEEVVAVEAVDLEAVVVVVVGLVEEEEEVIVVVVEDLVEAAVVVDMEVEVMVEEVEVL